MKLMVICLECAQEVFESKDMKKLMRLKQINVEMNDEGWYKVVCDRGHKFVTVLQQEKYETLFDFGLMALDDGYYREAVLNFASSLERFLEFCIKVFLYRNQNEIDPTYFNQTWKHIRNQSERQVGAFYFTFLSTLKVPPEMISNEWISFRNRVIHRGCFPDKSETMGYGEYVMEYINDTMQKVSCCCKDSVELVVVYDLMQKVKSAESEGLPISTACPPSTVSQYGKGKAFDLNSALKIMKANRLFQYTNTKEPFTYFADIDKGYGKLNY